MGHRLIAKRAEARELDLIHVLGELGSDGRGAVGAVGIHDDQFRGPAGDRRQAGAHVGLIIVRDDVHGHWKRAMHHSFDPNSFHDQILF